MYADEGFTFLLEAICIEHILDPALASRVSSAVTERTCSYCERQVDDDHPPIAVSMNVVGRLVFDAATWLFTEGYDGDPEDMGDFYYQQHDTEFVVASVLAGALDQRVSGLSHQRCHH